MPIVCHKMSATQHDVQANLSYLLFVRCTLLGQLLLGALKLHLRLLKLGFQVLVLNLSDQRHGGDLLHGRQSCFLILAVPLP
jgi:hypothetical protein